MQQIFDFILTNKVNIISTSVLIGRAYHALANGGGIKGILSSIWLGTNSPKVKPGEEPVTASTLKEAINNSEISK